MSFKYNIIIKMNFLMSSCSIVRCGIDYYFMCGFERGKKICGTLSKETTIHNTTNQCVNYKI